MNAKELLLKAKERILLEPKQFQMQFLYSRRNASPNAKEAEQVPNCGTSACIAGWMYSIYLKQNPRILSTKLGVKIKLDYSEIEGFELNLFEKHLFWVIYWPVKYQEQWLKAKSAAGKARVAARVIDNFIKEHLS